VAIYTRDAASALSELEQRNVRLGGQAKIINLCRTYVKAELGIWRPVAEAAVDILFSETVGPEADEPPSRAHDRHGGLSPGSSGKT
jgi:hypothetical protein